MSGLTLFIRGLPESASNERLEQIFSESGPLRQSFVVRERGTEKCRGFGYVTFSMLEDAQRAMKEIKEYDGMKIEVVVAKKKPREKDKKTKSKGTTEATNEKTTKDVKGQHRKARLIIRNLSFKCSEEDLKKHFSDFGSVLEVNIPKKPDGKMRGFAFVQFKNMLEASKALKATNMKSIKGRTIAVDWAIAKDKYTATQGVTANEDHKSTKQEGSAEEQEGASDNEASSDDEELNEEDSSAEEKPDSSTEDQEESLEDVSKSTKQKLNSQKLSDKPHASKSKKEDSEGGGDDEDDGSFDDDESSADSGQESDLDDESGDSDSESKKKVKKILPSDVNEGRTLFIRNLSFHSEEQDLEELFLRFGNIKYVRIVLHPDTEHSKGCAFVQFVDTAAVEKCLAAAKDPSENGGLKLAGRKLLVDLAVSREEAGKLREKKVKKPTGVRNLYLAREGLIREGTKAAEGLSKEDLAKRARFEEIKWLKLKSQNIFVSKTRLCVHNIPKSVDDKKLRELFLNAAGGGCSARIKECRVMRDLKGVEGNRKGQSLGYAFVEFLQHEHALAALRQVNNNPDLFGQKKRPIVEFSLEDMNKLKIKERRKQRSLEVLRQKQAKAQAASNTSGPAQSNSKKKPNKGGVSSTNKQSPAEKKETPQVKTKSTADITSMKVVAKKGTPVKTQPASAGTPKTLKRLQHGSGSSHLLEVKQQEVKGSSRAMWSGFQTKEEIELQELADGTKRRKVLLMPSHRGPKIRARDKGKLQQPPKKRPKPQVQSRQQQNQAKKQAPAKKKQHRSQAETRFNQLVEKYKRKILGKPGATAAPAKRSKWFED